MKLLSLNVRGLNNKIKRKLCFNEFLKYHICCLQETYVTQKSAKRWQSEWKGLFIYVPGTSNSKGLIILINKTFCFEQLQEFKINDRCLGITFKHDNQHFVIFNIYGPSKKEERVTFIENLPVFSEFGIDNSYVLAVGDMNMILNNDLDITNGLPHMQVEITAFNNFLTKQDLFDTWRHKHPFAKEYSWIRMYNDINTASFTARRLDYIFLNNRSKHALKNVDMNHFVSTDHKAVVADLNIDSYPRGRSLWKFNDSLLLDASFIEIMSSFINNHYDHLLNMNCFSADMIWDLIKIGIRDECTAFVRNKNVADWSNDLDLNIKNTSSLLASDPTNKTALKDLINFNKSKEIKDLAKARGALKRSRLRYIAEAESNTRYFLNLEQSTQSNTIIKELYNNNNILITSPIDITHQLQLFYTNLMNEPNRNDLDKGSEACLDAFLLDTQHPILNNEEQAYLDTNITINELFLALKSLNKDSSPGSDGLTPLFYLTFWMMVKTPLFESLNTSIENNSLSLSQRRAIISLLPKSKGDELRYLKTWRPLSLTNTDYKLLSKVLANRLQKVIKKLISINQVGYVAGRSINDHIRLIDDIINLSNIDDLPGIAVSLDFQKAFDMVSKKAILTTLKRFNFGNTFTSYVSMIINDTEASVKNANWYTEWFKTDRGVRQGCCLSPLLFILVVELLSIKIRDNPRIEGLLDYTSDDFGRETKLLMYADDISLFIKSARCLTFALQEVERFRMFSGLVLNRNKSIGMWLGSIKDNPEGGEGIRWLKATEHIKILGTYFSADTESSLLVENWNTKIESIKLLIMNWSKRNISIWGKCLVAKTFLLSKINYAIQSLALPDNILTIINNLIFKFIWRSDSNKNSFERINRNTLCLDIEHGGLGMISIEDQQQVMLLRWLHRLHARHKVNHTHIKIINKLLKQVGGFLCSYFSNTSLNLFKGLNEIKSTFWKKALTTWLTYKNACFKEDTPLYFIPIFNNMNISRGTKPLFIKRWIINDIKFVHQLFNEGRFKDVNEIREHVGTYGGLILDYLAVKNAVLKTYDPTLFINLDNHLEMKTQFDKLSNKDIRLKLVHHKKHIPKCKQLWLNRLDIDITNYYSLGVLASKESRLRTLHFKIIHSLYPTNILLNKMGIKDNNTCNVCPQLDTLMHFFFECNALRHYWNYIELLINRVLDRHIKINTIIALFGLTKEEINVKQSILNEANAIIILAKVCISKYKYSNIPNSLVFIFDSECLSRAKYFKILNPK